MTNLLLLALFPVFAETLLKDPIIGSDSQFQSEPMPAGATSSEYFLGASGDVTSRPSSQNPNSLMTSSSSVDKEDEENGAVVMYKHPKAFYPRPQNNYGGYGGFRPNPPPLGYSYVGYINRQARRYPVMMYTLIQCVPCQRAKHLLATTYGDVPSHFLELVGDEDWQRQLQVDLLKVTRQATFPYVFVCGQFVGGSSDLFNMHHSGQLRKVLNQCMNRNG